MSQQLSPFDCTRCEGKGYILDHHERLTCRNCEGRGIITHVVSPRLKEIRWKRKQIDFSLNLWREDLKKNKAIIKRLVEQNRKIRTDISNKLAERRKLE
jgi:RecJ-like exonuclease